MNKLVKNWLKPSMAVRSTISHCCYIGLVNRSTMDLSDVANMVIGHLNGHQVDVINRLESIKPGSLDTMVEAEYNRMAYKIGE